MPQKYSFRDPISNVLKCWGFVEASAPGDLKRAEPDDFNLIPGKWRLVDGAWQAYSPGQNAAILAQIDAIERQYMTNRGEREAWITILLEKAETLGKTEADLMDPETGNSFFRKLREVDNQIRALREQLQ